MFVHTVWSPARISELLLHKVWILLRFLLRQLCLNLMGELAHMFLHTLHAEPLRVEKTAFLAGEKKNLATLHFRVHAIVVRLKDAIFFECTICPCFSMLSSMLCNYIWTIDHKWWIINPLTDPTQTRFLHRLHSEPKIRNFSLSGLKGSLVTKHSSSNLANDSRHAIKSHFKVDLYRTIMHR